MSKKVRFVIRAALTVSCAAIPLAAGGCDKAENAANRKAISDLAQASLLLDKGKRPSDAQQNHAKANELVTAAARAEAPRATQAAAKAMLGELQYGKALGAIPQLADKEAEAWNQVGVVQALATQLAGDTETLLAYDGANPEGRGANQPLETYRKNIKNYQAELAKLDQTIADLQKQIGAKDAEIRDLEAKRTSALNKSAELLEKSEKAKGRETVDLFCQAQESQAEGADFGRKSGRSRVELERLQAALTETQNQKKVYQDSIAQVQARAQRLSMAWTETSVLTAARSAARKTTMGELTTAIKTLAETIKAADEMRKGIIDSALDAAIESYSGADSAAMQAGTELRNWIMDSRNADSPKIGAWRRLAGATAAENYKLAKARALQTRAGLYLGQKELLQARLQLATTLVPACKAAGVAVPAGLDSAAIAAELKAVRQEAETDLTAADDIYRGVIDTTTQGGRLDNTPAGKAIDKAYCAEASVGRVGVGYALYRVTDNPKQLDAVKATINELTGQNGQDENRPALPADLINLERTGIQGGASPAVAAPAPKTGGTPGGAAPAGGDTTPAPAPARTGSWGRLLGGAAGGGNAPAPAPAPAPDPTPAPDPAPADNK